MIDTWPGWMYEANKTILVAICQHLPAWSESLNRGLCPHRPYTSTEYELIISIFPQPWSVSSQTLY